MEARWTMILSNRAHRMNRLLAVIQDPISLSRLRQSGDFDLLYWTPCCPLRVAHGDIMWILQYKVGILNSGDLFHHDNIVGLPLVRPMGPIAAVAGRDLVVKCPVAGFPISAVTWEKGECSSRPRRPLSPRCLTHFLHRRPAAAYEPPPGRLRQRHALGAARGQCVWQGRVHVRGTQQTRPLRRQDRSRQRQRWAPRRRLYVASSFDRIFLSHFAAWREVFFLCYCVVIYFQVNFSVACVFPITFTVPPKIEPFSFPANIQAGTRVHVTCVVSEGDAPLKIQWLKDSSPASDVATHQIGDFDLALRIVNATPRHSGNYTCEASNAAARAAHTAVLLVHGNRRPRPSRPLPARSHPNSLSLPLSRFWLVPRLVLPVPPRIAPFSFNKDLSEGVRAQVTCVIEKGDPPFTIAWLKDAEPVSTSASPGLKVIGIDAHSSTIVVERLTARHTGNYSCVARNAVAEVDFTAELVVSGKALVLAWCMTCMSLSRHWKAPHNRTAPQQYRRLRHLPYPTPTTASPIRFIGSTHARWPNT